MDHISKALERAQTDRSTVRSWVKPSRSGRRLEIADAHLETVRINRDHLFRNRVLTGDDRDDNIVSDKYRVLRTRALQQMRQCGWNVLGVTSPGAQAGKSLTALNLAISIARSGSHAVAVVDADLRKPSLADYLGIAPPRGLVDFLASDIEPSDLLLRLDIDRLIVAPGRDDPEVQAKPELLASRRMTDLVAALRSLASSTIVIVDLPPVLVGDDVIALAPALDALLLVVEEGRTEIEALKKSDELLREFNLLGTVLNKSAEGKKHIDGYYHYNSGASSHG